ncbi:hypothetical protein RFI_15838 [Reticulomyxa filosa]|uniref:Uncharacterized protein n=1 Tax=Reticulomyxa filosa TaxID=46433 RepID=X6N5W2_RETFI|nr:hypothetical protein RFI_15838 [Reticulomyxa filosa]|eukprot:ETO21366.1 hypothetical protein RFI_15838 [Reticulomyxa filosa]
MKLYIAINKQKRESRKQKNSNTLVKPRMKRAKKKSGQKLNLICLICGNVANNLVEIACPRHVDKERSLIVGRSENACSIQPHANCHYSKNQPLECLINELEVVCPQNFQQEEQTSKLNLGYNQLSPHFTLQDYLIDKMKYNYEMSIGRHLCSVPADLTIQLWDIETFSTLQTFKEHSGVIRCVDFSFRRENRDNSVVAVMNIIFPKKKFIHLVDMKVCSKEMEEDNGITCVQFLPSEKQQMVFCVTSFCLLQKTKQTKKKKDVFLHFLNNAFLDNQSW